MKKIVLFVFVSAFFISVSFAAGPVTLEDFQKQQQEIVKMGVKVDEQVATYRVIIDYATRQMIAAQDFKQKLVDKFTELDTTIKKLQAVPAPAPAEPKPE